MDLLWRDNVGSFLDSLAADASGGSAPFTGGGVDLAWANLPSGSGGLTGQDTLWADPSSGTPIWQLADSTGTAGLTGLGDGSLSPPAATIPSDVGSLVWQATLFGLEEISAIAHSSTLDSTLNQVLDLVWTATGGSGSPPVTLPHAPSDPSFLLSPLPPSGLVWTGQPPLHGMFPDSTGQPLLTPVAGDSPLTGSLAGSAFSALAPQQLTWTDPSQGLPAVIGDPAAGVASSSPRLTGIRYDAGGNPILTTSIA